MLNLIISRSQTAWIAGMAALLLAICSPAAASPSAHELWPSCSPLPTATSRGQGRMVDPHTLADALRHLKPGDVLLLRSGDYGSVTLTGDFPEFVTIAAAPKETPLLTGLSVQGSHWLIKGISIAGPSKLVVFPSGWEGHFPLIQLRGDNLAMVGDTVASRLDGQVWQSEVKGHPPEAPLSSGVKAVNDWCVTLADNHFFNIFNAIEVGGDQVGQHGHFYLIDDNKIDNFAGDGVDFYGSDMVISRNVITDGHDICSYQCIHMDGIQGWSWLDNPAIIDSNILIDSNIVIQQTSDQLPLPSHDMHGITIFDGGWKNVKAVNNLVVTESWNGLVLCGVDGLLIENNTVLGVGVHTTFLSFGRKANEGNLPNNAVVRNNIGPSIAPNPQAPPGQHNKMDHNLVYHDPSEVFKLVDMHHWHFDLHPRPGSPAIGRGSTDDAPAFDIEGKPRRAPVTLGAYQSVAD